MSEWNMKFMHIAEIYDNMKMYVLVSDNMKKETIYVDQHTCSSFRTKFEHGDYSFGSSANTTFLVYVYGFKTPFWLQVKLSFPVKMQYMCNVNVLKFLCPGLKGPLGACSNWIIRLSVRNSVTLTNKE